MASGTPHPLGAAAASLLLLRRLNWLLPFHFLTSCPVLGPLLILSHLSFNAVSVLATWEFKHQCYVVGSQICVSSPGLFQTPDACGQPPTQHLHHTALGAQDTQLLTSPLLLLCSLPTPGEGRSIPGEGRSILPGGLAGDYGLILHSSPFLTPKLICQQILWLQLSKCAGSHHLPLHHCLHLSLTPACSLAPASSFCSRLFPASTHRNPVTLQVQLELPLLRATPSLPSPHQGLPSPQITWAQPPLTSAPGTPHCPNSSPAQWPPLWHARHDLTLGLLPWLVHLPEHHSPRSPTKLSPPSLQRGLSRPCFIK